MHYNEFIGQVKERANITTETDALRATRATLQALSERTYGNESKHIASQLPEELKPFVAKADCQEKYSLDEFYSRVSNIEEVDIDTARSHAKAVASVLQNAITEGETGDLKAQLPKDYDELFH